MKYDSATIQTFLSEVFPFQTLSKETLHRLSQQFQWWRYRMGQVIVNSEQLPEQIVVLYEGKARILGRNDPTPITLELLQPGEIIGWVSLIRQVPCELAIASTETIGLTLSKADFFNLLKQEPQLDKTFRARCSIVEAFDLLTTLQQNKAQKIDNLKELASQATQKATIHYLFPGKNLLNSLNSNQIWVVSGGEEINNYPIGSCLDLEQNYLEVTSKEPVRLVGFPNSLEIFKTSSLTEQVQNTPLNLESEIPYALEPIITDKPQLNSRKKLNYPDIRGRGTLEAALACCQMLCQHLGLPFRRDTIVRVLENQLQRTGSISLELLGAVAELMGLTAQLFNIPTAAISRLQTPSLIAWQDSFALIYEVNSQEIILAIPEIGLRRKKIAEFTDVWGESGLVLLLQTSKTTPKQKFSLAWFIPSLYRYRRVLIEVLIASFFVQLFGLANPLIIQLIIDKVIVQNSIDTLHVLGIFLLIVAIFEALLTSLRTYLFVDTTNRIDIALGSEIIDHLLRLPLRYFERRPVGELSTRVNELENIRSFLTSTALTVVLDAIFSVIYIVAMVFYSWKLTLFALATIPLFIILTVVVSPIVRVQLRTKAEQNAATQSYLVELLSGIQTVKAQNIELRSRWQWQERYSKYISTGFKTVKTFTAASSTSNFLNQLSGLLVLWAGAYMVLKGDLTLGQLIAFRIIAGYVTSPLLRLVQLWQNFQETALSLERLSDIIDTPQEADELDRQNIPMPNIIGAVRFEDISFSYNPNTPLQLQNVTLEFPAGVFIGLVGLSGSGKSTLVKLIPRLYEPNLGRILVDNYDVGKVELYSLRRQIGIVPQDPLLFEGTIQENIMLTNPDATAEEMIAAAQVAVAHDFIMNLPKGYNTAVGERGASLSGGQRQRIAIARTILQNPRLLILDEATSALDYNTERQLCLNLAEVFQGRTVFFITHRLNTIRKADVILMMDSGVAVEQGTHDELMELKGRYYALFQQQESNVS